MWKNILFTKVINFKLYTYVEKEEIFLKSLIKIWWISFIFMNRLIFLKNIAVEKGKNGKYVDKKGFYLYN